MAIFGADFPIVHEEETPWLRGMDIGKNLIAKELANRKANITNQIYGVQQKYAEPNAQQELQKAILFNKYYGPEKEADIAHTGSLTNRINQMLPMELEAALLKNKQSQYDYNNPTAESPAGKQLHDLVRNKYITSEKAQELAEHLANNMQTTKSDFDSLPSDYKAAYLSQIENMGYSKQQSIQHARNGDDLGDLAQAKGYQRDLSDVPTGPTAPTGATRTAVARSNMATAGLNAADNFINKGIAHYSGQATYKGTPSGFYLDAIRGKNKGAQSDFIAATTLAQDQAFLRARQAGAPLSQGLLEHTLSTSLTNVKGRFSFVSPDVFLDAGKKIKANFDAINKAETKAAYQQGTEKKQPGKKDLESLEQEIPTDDTIKSLYEEKAQLERELGHGR
jgi:hypothetical protein